MRSTFSLVFVALISIGIVTAHHEVREAKKHRKSKEELSELSCKEMQTYVAKEAMEAMAHCQHKLGYHTREERKGKLLCVLKCIGIEEGMLNQDGTVSREGIDAFINEHVPDRFHAFIYPVLNDCVFSQEIEVDSEDEFCNSYKPIMKCVMKWVGHVDQKMMCELYDSI